MIITLTTDFGYADPFVGIMKGVIADINPRAQVVDLSHGVPPQDIMTGALIIRNAFSYFPRGTIHVAVVDPGVGSTRVPLLIATDSDYFIGPDNGVLSLAVENLRIEQLVQLSNRKYHLKPTSKTFHGRDIFAPVAAHLSLGVDALTLGKPAVDFSRLSFPRVTKLRHGIAGKVVYIDRFGNLSTNIRETDLKRLPKKKLVICMKKLVLYGVLDSYAEDTKRGGVAVINSSGLLEIAVYGNSAQRRFRAKIGDPVQVTVNKKHPMNRRVT